MNIQELRKKLAKFDDNLPIVFCSETNEQVRIFTVTHICQAEALLSRDDDGNLHCKLGKSPVSGKHVFIDLEPAE